MTWRRVAKWILTGRRRGPLACCSPWTWRCLAFTLRLGWGALRFRREALPTPRGPHAPRPRPRGAWFPVPSPGCFLFPPGTFSQQVPRFLRPMVVGTLRMALA